METYEELLAQKADIERQLSQINSDDLEKKLLTGISNQRLFFIKNRPKIIFDSHTGYLFLNSCYLSECLRLFETNVDSDEFDDYLKHVHTLVVEGYDSWIFPGDKEFKRYSDPALFIIDNFYQDITVDWHCRYKSSKDERTRYFISNSSKRTGFRGFTDLYYEYNLPRLDKGDNYDSRVVAMPFTKKLYSEDFNPKNKVYSQEERAQKLLDFFIQEGWTPKFDEDALTKLFETVYVTGPTLIKQLTEVTEALAATSTPTTKFADHFRFGERIKHFDIVANNSSPVRYYAETIRWLDNLLADLDGLVSGQSDLLAEARALTNRLTVAHHDDENPVLSERARHLALRLDFGVETLQSELLSFKSEAVSGRECLSSSRSLAALSAIDKLERPDFLLVAEHTTALVVSQLVAIDWFREHKELASNLIDLHEAWRDDFHQFDHTTRDHFIQKCKIESIEQEQADGWFGEWRKERLLLEEHILPLMKAGIENIIPVEIAISCIELLKTAIRDRLAKFFFDERIALHQKFAFEPGGELQERFEKESKLSEINGEFQGALEELIFMVQSSEGRLFLVRWAKDWYSSFLGDVLALVEQDTLQGQIARETLDEFRAMKRRNLEGFLADVKTYAEAREQIDKQMNSLVFRMRSDLAKKSKVPK